MLCKHLQEMAECVVLFHDAERPRVGQLLVLLKGDAAKKKKNTQKTWCAGVNTRRVGSSGKQ